MAAVSVTGRRAKGATYDGGGINHRVACAFGARAGFNVAHNARRTGWR